MSDEEKKAIQYLNKYCDTDLLYEQRHYNYIKMIIRLVGKQSKEIGELKKYKKYYEEMEEVNKKFISVDKIKAKIEEVSKGTFDAKIVLQSLLEKE